MVGRWYQTDPHRNGRGRATQPCPTCAPEHYEIIHNSGLFVAKCPDCGRLGPEEDSVYDAAMAWRRLNGSSAPSKDKMVLAIAAFLLLAVLISVFLSWFSG